MDSKLRNHDGPLLASIERRLFLRRGLSLGALSLLSGCDLTDKLTYDDSVQKMLTAMSRWNDGVQSWIFDPKRLAELAEGISSDVPAYFDRGKSIVEEGQPGSMDAAGGGAGEGRGRPGVAGRVVATARVGVRGSPVIPAPHDHTGAGPCTGVVEARARSAGNRCPES